MIANKTIQYSVSAERDGKMATLFNTTSVQLPPWEKQTDAIKGAGIMGEVNIPSPFGFAAASATLAGRVDDEMYAYLATPGRRKLEVRWVTDEYDAATGDTRYVRHRVIMMGSVTKRDPGKVETNSPQDMSLEVSVTYYKNEIDGKVIEEIDVLNCKYVVNGVDYAAEINSFLN